MKGIIFGRRFGNEVVSPDQKSDKNTFSRSMTANDLLSPADPDHAGSADILIREPAA